MRNERHARAERRPARRVVQWEEGEVIDLAALLKSIELSFIDEALRRSGGCRATAAQLLGINRTTLVEKLRRYGRLRPTVAAVDAARTRA